MIGPGKLKLHGQLRLSEQTDTVCTLADTWYKISGTMIDGCECGFRVGGNKLTYTGPSGMVFSFNGTSDVRVSKASILTYGLFRNGELITSAQTPHTFPASARIQNLSITSLCELNQNDEMEVYMKSSEAGLTASVYSLNINFMG
jgi:hypothetical protein